jgi:hypothetical protein
MLAALSASLHRRCGTKRKHRGLSTSRRGVSVGGLIPFESDHGTRSVRATSISYGWRVCAR